MNKSNQAAQIIRVLERNAVAAIRVGSNIFVSASYANELAILDVVPADARVLEHKSPNGGADYIAIELK